MLIMDGQINCVLFNFLCVCVFGSCNCNPSDLASVMRSKTTNKQTNKQQQNTTTKSASTYSPRSYLQEGVQRQLFLAVDVAAGGEVEVGRVALAGPHVPHTVVQLRAVGGGLLVAELVARHTQDGDRVVLVLQLL